MWRLDTLFDFIAHSKIIKRRSHNYNKKKSEENKTKQQRTIHVPKKEENKR